ncbi:MAG TPA: glycoside hydrolase family 2 protein [Flavobacterium sp.]|uniref:beta-mannosidase n=2 Tax=Flavobacterium TaxID=237 RepID=UPI0025C6C0B5|nr:MULTISPECIES: glycoside hydrolase family 2 protein [unclassified Flavobacterium]HRE77425.1 glycoside hydrolase family 2 protein [Flavobacterium sp.]
MDKNWLSILVFFFCSFLGFSQNSSRDLSSENWTFKKVNDSNWFSAKVPGTIHTDLFQNNLIPDPFFGANEKELQWIEEEDWLYKTDFQITKDELENNIIELNFDGLDTYATVFLNGKKVLLADNMFRSWKIDVKNQLKIGKNTIEIHFESASKKGEEESQKLSYTLPEKERVFVRKAQYHFGWDWAPRFVTAGIWKKVHLKFWNKAKIENILYDQKLLNTEIAKMDFVFTVTTEKSGKYQIRLGEKPFPFQLKKGQNTVKIPIEISNPILWWCNGLGVSHLYIFRFSLEQNGAIIDEKELKIGLRTIELVQENDEKGKSFYFKLNGKPVFIKGANVIPSDSFLPRITDSTYFSMVKEAKNANMNMLRVWGGGVYADDAFYDACDSNGILVWQDFMFACAMYPGDNYFLENVKQEVIDNVIRLRNHPSIALWCGNNENDEGWHNWGWQKQYNYSKSDSTKIWNDYQKLFHQLIPKTLDSLLPKNENRYWPSSPSLGWGRKESLTQGDVHYWGVWWGKEPFEIYNQKVGRFVSEYGFQGMPSVETLQKVLSKEEMNFNSDAFKNHQKHPTGFETIREYMERDFIIPEKLEDFAYVSQLLQARGMKIAIEAHRRAMPNCMGTLFWQLNDCWPVTSWSAIDYYGDKKAFYYQTQRSFDPLLVHVYQNNSEIEIYTINDNQSDFSGKLKLKIIDFQGNKLWNDSVLVKSKSNFSEIQFKITETILNQFDKKEIVLQAEFISENQIKEAIHFFAKPKELALKKPTIQVNHIDKNTIELKSDILAIGVFLQDEGITFDTNYFDLLPNQKKIIKTSDFVQNLKIKTLFDTLKKK